jgi:hypothetical protein
MPMPTVHRSPTARSAASTTERIADHRRDLRPAQVDAQLQII